MVNFPRSQLKLLIIGGMLATLFVTGLIPAVRAGEKISDKPCREILGYQISCSNDTSNCQLIDAGETSPQIVHRSYRKECEKKLVNRLKEEHGTGQPNLPFWTLGGKQFWADSFIYHGWRIQENVFTGHHRLLDPQNVRKAWGDYEACRTAFAELRLENQIEARSSHWVFLLHGLFRAKESMGALRDELRRRGYEANTINYPSTQKSIRAHAQQLQTIVRRADGAETVSFVTHSLGGIVVRKLFELSGWQNKVKPGRIVMIAPPNKGSRMAELLEDFLPYELLAGESGEQLTEEYVRKLPVPDVEIGIIAGTLESGEGWNPLVSGSDDGTISVETTKLKGAKDFLKVPGLHSFLPGKSQVIKATGRFLETGRFSAKEED